jgi:ribosome-associated protein
MDTQNILNIAANALNNKKARALKALKVDSLTTIADYFLIATATSSTHVRALADEVEDKLKEQSIEPHHIEGRTTGWIVLDYSSVIVHVFTPDQREFYNLDSMWSDAQEINLESILDEAEGD